MRSFPPSPSSPPSPLSPPITLDQGEFRILVLEDDRFFQKTIKKGIALTIPKPKTDCVCTAEQALAHIRLATTPYQLAIIDLHLPDGDGIEVIRHIAQTHPDTSIMVLSVASDEKKVLQAVRAGATGYVVKGDITLSITRAIEQLVSGIYPISPSLAGYFLRLAGRESSGSIAASIEPLTGRELELLREFANGKSYQEAADTMKISITTVRTHTTNLYRKLGVKSSLRALSVAKDHGLI
jgi:DNA-binding NarL/FixJ family response regulator